jgi:hypothetical protein
MEAYDAETSVAIRCALAMAVKVIVLAGIFGNTVESTM